LDGDVEPTSEVEGLTGDIAEAEPEPVDALVARLTPDRTLPDRLYRFNEDSLNVLLDGMTRQAGLC
jgi:hypothetical protein